MLINNIDHEILKTLSNLSIQIAKSKITSRKHFHKKTNVKLNFCEYNSQKATKNEKHFCFQSSLLPFILANHTITLYMAKARHPLTHCLEVVQHAKVFMSYLSIPNNKKL